MSRNLALKIDHDHCPHCCAGWCSGNSEPYSGCTRMSTGRRRSAVFNWTPWTTWCSSSKHTLRKCTLANINVIIEALPWLRRLVAGLSSRWPGWTKWHWDSFCPSPSVFHCQYHSTMTLHAHIIWEMDSRPVDGHSSETWSYPIDMNNNNIFKTIAINRHKM
jgi:hypothetical protein